MITIASRIGAAVCIYFLCMGAIAHAGPLSISGKLTGTASESLTGRCAPAITVSANASGTATVLGAFSDTQSHCDMSFTTFGDGLLALTSLTSPMTSLSGTYSGDATPGSGGVLDFSANLQVTHGSGIFAGFTGDLLTNGTLNAAGIYRASFSGTLTQTPEPGSLWLIVVVSLALLFARKLRRYTQFDARTDS